MHAIEKAQEILEFSSQFWTTTAKNQKFAPCFKFTNSPHSSSSSCSQAATPETRKHQDRRKHSLPNLGIFRTK